MHGLGQLEHFGREVKTFVLGAFIQPSLCIDHGKLAGRWRAIDLWAKRAHALLDVTDVAAAESVSRGIRGASTHHGGEAGGTGEGGCVAGGGSAA